MSSKNKILRPKIKTNYDRPTKQELDKLWRECVLLKYGKKCEYPLCNKVEFLNVHHIYSRSRMSTRWEIDNAIILCSGHHSLNNDSAHKDPDFKDILIKNDVRTKEFFDKLRFRAFQPAKLDLNAIKIYLLNELKRVP
ncbi:MAG: hypothetical protein Q8O27_01615 [Enterobacteriaceae bacterium]|nr:hypothetical protein [Enterobacteriaceae bacterium]